MTTLRRHRERRDRLRSYGRPQGSCALGNTYNGCDTSMTDGRGAGWCPSRHSAGLPPSHPPPRCHAATGGV